MSLIRKLRDFDAWLTSYGQCIRCGRSWRYASPVMVGFGLGSPYFCLCVGCYRHEVVKPDAGLILQGWAARAMQRNQLPLGIGYADRQREVMAAYGMAPRFPLEVALGWSKPEVYRVRVIDERRRNRLGRADLSPTGERVAPPTAKYSPGQPNLDDHDVLGLGEQEPWPMADYYARTPHDFEPLAGGPSLCAYCGLYPESRCHSAEAPGWDGAGADVEAQRG